jgi:hypothetical protein
LKFFPWVVSVLFASNLFVSATALTGTLTNVTTGKPAAGDKVVLIKLGQGMEEVAHATTDAQGKFHLSVPDDGMPHLVRAFHQDVTYHAMVPPGTPSVEVQVYDAGKKIQGISVTADIMRFQAQGNELQGIRLFAVDNQSKPPRTQMSPQNLEFYLPEGAVLDEGIAMTEGGQPLKSIPIPETVKNRYRFDFPLRPGTTQFQAVFHMPYSGAANFDPKPLYASRHFVVMLPKTIEFAGAPGTTFQSMKDPRQADAVVQIASNTKPGQLLAFKISGTGTFPEQGQQGGEPAATQSEAANQTQQPGGRDTRPGGGLGPPIDAPDPLQKSWPYILLGFGALLAAGAVYTMKRPHPAGVHDFGRSDVEIAEPTPIPKPKAARSSLMEALKEELFQLELDHKQGHISQEEYDKAKAAMDQTLERAIKRNASTAS